MMPASSVPPGGPATISGVLYQAIVALARCARLHAIHVEQDAQTADVTAITMVLEPATGGDQEIRSEERIVEQIKRRSTGPWSLRDVIVEVLPDLYRAVDLDRPALAYRFVTNARIGEWDSAYHFFRSLKTRARRDILAELDDTQDLDFVRRSRGVSGFWESGPYTERRLFNRIVAHLSSQTSAANEPADVVEFKTWELLSKLDVKAEKDFGEYENAVNRWVEQQIDAIEQVPAKRQELVADLLRRAAHGHAVINPIEFFKAHGLTATPLSDWDEHVRKGRALLARELETRDYSSSQDVRPEVAASAAAQWRGVQTFFAIAGESGQGKSWFAFSMLSQFADQDDIALFVEATGHWQRDIDALAATLWQNVIGHDNPVPLTRVRERLARIDPILAVRPIFLLVDGVSSLDEGFHLARLPLEELSFRLAITCSTEIADDLEESIRQERFRRFNVADFSSEELTRYLSGRVGTRWIETPPDVRATLRRPLLSKLYCDMVGHESWRPTLEYELYERYWNRLYMGEHREHPMDAGRLAKAAFELLRGGAYPWTTEQVCGTSTDDSLIPRLIRNGWIRSRKPGFFEVWHDRLLNWAVAQGSVTELENERIEGAELVKLIQGLGGPEHAHGSLLRYVAMDVLWLVSAPDRNLPDLSAAILEALEEEDI